MPEKTPKELTPKNGDVALTMKATAVAADVHIMASDARRYTNDRRCAIDGNL